jgi:hypothetical protein
VSAEAVIVIVLSRPIHFFVVNAACRHRERKRHDAVAYKTARSHSRSDAVPVRDQTFPAGRRKVPLVLGDSAYKIGGQASDIHLNRWQENHNLIYFLLLMSWISDLHDASYETEHEQTVVFG